MTGVNRQLIAVHCDDAWSDLLERIAALSATHRKVILVAGDQGSGLSHTQSTFSATTKTFSALHSYVPPGVPSAALHSTVPDHVDESGPAVTPDGMQNGSQSPEQVPDQ